MRKRFPRILPVLALCLGLRLLFLVLMQPWALSVRDQIVIQNDSPLYHRLACSLLDHGALISDGLGGPPELHPVAVKGQHDDLRTPLYPAFIAAVYAVFGRLPWTVLVVQAFLDTATCALLFVTLRRAFTERAATISALLYAVDPQVILYVTALLSEGLFLFFLVAALSVFVWLMRESATRVRMIGYAVLGIVLGLATLVRPIAQYLPVLLVPLILNVERNRMRLALLFAAIFAVAFTAAVSPWLIRNQRLFGRPALTYIAAWDLLALNVAITEAARQGLDVSDVQPRLLGEAEQMMRADGKEPGSLSNLQKAAYWQTLGLRYAVRDPLRFTVYHLKGMGRVMSGLATGDLARALRLSAASSPSGAKSAAQLVFAVLVLAMLVVAYSSGIGGLIVGWRTHDRRVLLFCLVMAFYFVAATGALGVVRLKLPAVPFYLAFSGIGFEAYATWRKNRSARHAASP